MQKDVSEIEGNGFEKDSNSQSTDVLAGQTEKSDSSPRINLKQGVDDGQKNGSGLCIGVSSTLMIALSFLYSIEL